MHFSKIGAQDEGFCFSPDGRYFLNIEKPIHSTAAELAIYETEKFQIEQRLFQDEQRLVLSHIEYDVEKAAYYVLGFCRGNDGVYSYEFVSQFQDNKLIFLKRISDKAYDYLDAYKSLELKGFTNRCGTYGQGSDGNLRSLAKPLKSIRTLPKSPE